jgi:hypothetical protein
MSKHIMPRSKALPCPWCGGKATLALNWSEPLNCEEHRVICDNDGCFVNPHSQTWATSARAAINAWNNREHFRRSAPDTNVGEMPETGKVDAKTDAIISKIQYWLDWQEERRAEEKLPVNDELAFYSVPHWPSRGMFKEWIKHLRDLANSDVSDINVGERQMRSAEEWIKHFRDNPVTTGFYQSPIDSKRMIEMVQNDAIASRVVPEGWVLVPKEPTTVMDNAGANEGRLYLKEMRQADARHIYKAMIAAAPPHPQESADALDRA